MEPSTLFILSAYIVISLSAASRRIPRFVTVPCRESSLYAYMDMRCSAASSSIPNSVTVPFRLSTFVPSNRILLSVCSILVDTDFLKSSRALSVNERRETYISPVYWRMKSPVPSHVPLHWSICQSIDDVIATWARGSESSSAPAPCIPTVRVPSVFARNLTERKRVSFTSTYSSVSVPSSAWIYSL